MRASAFFLTFNVGVLMAFSGKLKDMNPLETQKDLSYRLSQESLEKIDSIGFVLLETAEYEIYDLYDGYETSPYTPMFISTDLVLHTMHLLVDRTVRKMEVEELLPKLETLTKSMFEKAKRDYEGFKGQQRDVAARELVYFTVASRLLGDEPLVGLEIKKMADEEVAKIENHEGIRELSFLPGVKEDYSQYVPRGHYTRSEDLKRYFMTMMWYGRLPLHVPKATDGGEKLLAFKTAVLISWNLSGDGKLRDTWSEIYNPTAFFFGSAEDLTPDNVYSAVTKYCSGEKVDELLSDETRLREIAKYLRETYKPKILSEYAESKPGEEPVEVPLSFRFMPQRFVPDSYIFTELVADRVRGYEGEYLGGGQAPFTFGMTEMGPMRVFPRGLDVMSVLGWRPAEEIISAEGDAMYENYPEQLEKMREWHSSLPDEEKASSIYFRWFETFSAYKQAVPPGDVDPDAWARKMLLTALGSWTELRHDAILYAKQSYTAYATGAPPGRDTEPPPPPLKLAVLEESPEVYVIMAECSSLIAGFLSASDESNPIRYTFENFREMLSKLDTLSRKQMFESLSKDEHEWLWSLPARLSGLEYSLGDIPETQADKRMALVADVHTDPNTNKVLEEATGNPARIYIVSNINGKRYVAQGAAFSYYEFKQAISDRLTDEAWQEKLDREEAPAMPDWTLELFSR